MTTPQNELYNLSYQVSRLREMFGVADDEQDIFDNVKDIHKSNEMIVKRLDGLKDQMDLIIKLLAK